MCDIIIDSAQCGYFTTMPDLVDTLQSLSETNEADPALQSVNYKGECIEHISAYILLFFYII